MAELAKSAVLVSSTAEMPVDVKESVSGPSWEDLHSVEAVLRKCGTVGFQASNLASAISICKMMLKPQTPSPSLLPTADGNGKADREGTTASLMVQPTIFVGVTANLLGTGCRDAIRFLCKECVPLPEGVEPAALPDDGQCAASTGSEGAIRPSPCASQALIHVLVVSGGAMEHDIRSVCEPYRLSKSGGEATHESRFGNVSYSNAGAGTDGVFSEVMRRLVERLAKAQREERARCEASPIPDAYYDVCSWAVAPSTLWHMAGIWLPDLLAEALQEVGGFEEESAASEEASRRAQNTVLYWAARNGVPIFSPSLTDGDIMQFILPEGTENTPSLQLDLVSDIHRLNKLAMLSRRTGMIILGGGVVKHHVCNANLMRNGADYAVYLNDGQEFDGSDAGARPDEAVSWGKLRLNSSYVKVYSEVSLVLPLLVAHVFVDWVRTARV